MKLSTKKESFEMEKDLNTKTQTNLPMKLSTKKKSFEMEKDLNEKQNKNTNKPANEVINKKEKF